MLAAKEKGRSAERFAETYYRDEGFEILETNYRYGAFEVDLIARKGCVVHFVEVKFRKTLADANLALNQSQFWRIAKAAEFYLRDRQEFMQIDGFLVDHKLHWERLDNIMLA